MIGISIVGIVVLACMAAPSIVLFFLSERYAVLTVFGIEVVVLALVTWYFWPSPITACPQGECDGQMFSWLLAVPIVLTWIVTTASAIVRFFTLPN